MSELSTVCGYLDGIFAKYLCEDSSNNGLQVESGTRCNVIAFAVDACLDTILKAGEAGADLLVVHHGLSWRSGFKYLNGVDGRRMRELFTRGISLYGMHLPLDAHEEIGNNVVMAAALELPVTSMCCEIRGLKTGVLSRLSTPISLQELNSRLQRSISPNTKVLDNTGGTAKNIMLLSGAADVIRECVEEGADCLITGEFFHQTFHLAEEQGVSVIAAGHYCTERTGITALMNKTQAAFPDIKCVFIDAPTGL